MNPRQTTQLNNALAQSLHKHLDSEHGSGKAAKVITDAHLADILKSAHFGSSPMRPLGQRANAPKRRGSLDKMSVYELQSGVLQGMVTVDRFLQEVAAGEATFKSAESCMRFYHVLEAANKQHDYTLPGQVVWSWLWSTGLADSLEFLHHKNFVKLLIQHLYSEKSHARVASWYSLFDSNLSREHHAAFEHLMYVHIRVHARAHGLDSTLRLFNEILAKQQLQDPRTKQFLPRSAARFLIYRLIPVTKPDNQLRIGSDVYESFVQHVEQHVHAWLPSKTLHHDVARNSYFAALGNWCLAALDLAHPQAPSGERALSVLAAMGELLTRDSDEDMTEITAKMAYLYAMTAKWYTAQGRLDDSFKMYDSLLKLLMSGKSKFDPVTNLPNVEISRADGRDEERTSLLISFEDMNPRDLVVELGAALQNSLPSRSPTAT